MLTNKCTDWQGHIQSAQAGFDGDFPNAANTQVALMLWILDQLTTVSIQSGIAGDESQEDVRVEQDSHGTYSSKPGIGASKSAPI